MEQCSYTMLACLRLLEVTEGRVHGQKSKGVMDNLIPEVLDVGACFLTGWQRLFPDKVQMLFQRTSKPFLRTRPAFPLGSPSRNQR